MKAPHGAFSGPVHFVNTGKVLVMRNRPLSDPEPAKSFDLGLLDSNTNPHE